MSSELRVPIVIPAEWGSSPVRVINWLVEKGESVLAGDALVEMGQPGIVGDVCADVNGRVVEILVSEGSWAAPGSIVGWLQRDEGSASSGGEFAD